MNSTMDRESHHRAVQRALALGRSADPGALAELACLLATPSAEVRRLAASAIGKLAGFGADPAEAVRALAPVALHDPQPQTPEMLAPMSSTFDTFFRAATGLHLTGEATATQAGNTPYGYQCRLACGERNGRPEAEWLTGGTACKSQLIDIPTGLAQRFHTCCRKIVQGGAR